MKKPKFLIKLAHPSNLYEALRPLVFLLSIAGIPPFDLRPPVNVRLSKRICFGSALGLVYLLIFIGSFSLTFGQLTIFTSVFTNQSVSQIADLVLVTSTLFAMLFVFLSVFVKKYNFRDIVHIIYRVDLRLVRLPGVQLQHSKTVVKIFKYSVISSLLYFFYVFGSYHMMKYFNHDAYFFALVSYFMPHQIFILVLFKYHTVLHVIRVRFTIINKVSWIKSGKSLVKLRVYDDF